MTLKMKIWHVEYYYQKWNDNIEFQIIFAKTKYEAKKIAYLSNQSIKSCRLLGFTLKNKKSGIYCIADLSDA